MRKISIIFLLAFQLNGKPAIAQDVTEGKKMLQYRRHQSAEKIFSGLLEKNNTDTVAAYWFGQSLLSRKEGKKAVAHFQSFLQNSNSHLVNAGLAEAYASIGQTDRAKEILNRISQKTGEHCDEELGNALARAYMRLADFANAEEYFKKVLFDYPGNKESLRLLGNLAMEKMNGSEAYDYFQASIAADSNYAPSLFDLARLYLMRKEPANYLPALWRTLSKDSLFAPAWYELYRYAFYHDKAMMRNYYSHYLEVADKTADQELQLLVMAFNAKKYQTVIAKTRLLAKQQHVVLPAICFQYASISHYFLGEYSLAWKDMSHYLEIRSPENTSDYTIYLAAKLAMQAPQKDELAISVITSAFFKDSLQQFHSQYAASLANYYISRKDSIQTTVWKERLLPFKKYAKEDMYKVALSWFALGKPDRADSLVTAMRKRHPEAYKAIYLQALIKAGRSFLQRNTAAAGYFETFLAKTAGVNTIEYKSMKEQSYHYLGDFYLAQKNYPLALANYQSLAKYHPRDKALAKTIRDLSKWKNP